MQPLHLFVDTHDKAHQTFPENLSREAFEGFFVSFEAACRAEGVVLLKSYAGLADGRAFCLTLAPSAEAVRRAHERAGLPFDSVTEVETASTADTSFMRHSQTV